MDGQAMKFLDKFEKLDRLALLTVKLEGGDKLVVREEIGFIPLFMMMGMSMRTQVGAAPPIPVPVPAPKAPKKE
jgi:hypothetical protein